MSTQPLSPIRKAWYRWKSLKLPWRKRFLVGLDLQGNSFWEFKDALTANRMRRIVQYPRATPYSEVKLSPQWHQWLRHTRFEPPSLTEQSQDLIRQEQLKVLAARADARWAAKESYLDAPPKQQQQLPQRGLDGGRLGSSPGRSEAENTIRENALGSGDVDANGNGEVNREEASPTARTKPNTRTPDEKNSKAKGQADGKDPWKQARGGPSEQWQPQSWSGGTTSRDG